MIKDIIENYTKYVDDKDPATKCLDIAIITDPKKRTRKTIKKLATIAGRVLKK